MTMIVCTSRHLAIPSMTRSRSASISSSRLLGRSIATVSYDQHSRGYTSLYLFPHLCEACNLTGNARSDGSVVLYTYLYENVICDLPYPSTAVAMIFFENRVKVVSSSDIDVLQLDHPVPSPSSDGTGSTEQGPGESHRELGMAM